MQMAGRAGRQGIDDEGLVYSILDGRALLEAPLEKIVRGQPEPVQSRFQLSYSSLLHLVPTLGRERVHEAWEKSFHQFQARGGSPKVQQKIRRRQGALVDAHLAVLDQLGYLENGSRLTDRGRIGRNINGYELQATELLFQGAIETLGPEALAVVFVALIHEERSRTGGPFVPASMHGNVRRNVSAIIGQAAAVEAEHGIETPMKAPDWGLTPAVIAWCEGRAIEELEDVTEASPGDVCRTFRMAIQVMREVRHAIDPRWDLGDRLAAAIGRLNRDEVDAKRQLELG
jgi:superfamily II RNA helicase